MNNLDRKRMLVTPLIDIIDGEKKKIMEIKIAYYQLIV